MWTLIVGPFSVARLKACNKYRMANSGVSKYRTLSEKNYTTEYKLSSRSQNLKLPLRQISSQISKEFGLRSP